MEKIKNFIGFALIALAIFWFGHISVFIQKSLKTFQQIQEQGPSYVQIFVFLNVVFPIICLAGILIGAILILRNNNWGYYIGFISVLGYAAVQFLSG
ncbi:MAG: hypothetical protein P9M07_07685 [Candidatus Aceula meridiana]|nr:hypothetical protein [Candidatus Aceula meridiana]